MILTGDRPKDTEKNRPSAAFLATNPTWTDLGLYPGLRGEKPAINHLNYGTVPWTLCAWKYRA
jgi:hypothetical protein